MFSSVHTHKKRQYNEYNMRTTLVYIGGFMSSYGIFMDGHDIQRLLVTGGAIALSIGAMVLSNNGIRIYSTEE